jgi:hypothetical protein
MKKIWQSKTFWIAILQALTGIVIAFATNYPTAGWLLVLKSCLDIATRFITDKGVSL